MGYRELPAPAALAGLVECGWIDTAMADGAQQVLPCLLYTSDAADD